MRALHYQQTRWLPSFSRWTAACVAAACVLATSPADAAIPVDCSELGIAITEHSCFHSEFGPFETVMATAGSMVSAATPNIDPVHTEFRIGLTGEYSVVTYTPKRRGAWAVLLGKDVPLQVLAGQAERLPASLDQNGTTGCNTLPLLHVFELTEATKYRFVFGPTAERTVVAVVEYIDDFMTQNGRDVDGDGFGSKQEVIVTPCAPPQGFAPSTRDCDDTDPLINPGTEETCDGIDQNCNGVADDVGLACHTGKGACRAPGTTLCTAGSGATCSASPLESGEETCNGIDDDCNGKIDDAGGLCTAPDRPTCVRNGMAAACGCLLDLDCGDVMSGRVCNRETGACEDGCSPLPGGNGCSPGEVCDAQTVRCEPQTGAGGVDGAAGDASLSGSAGVSGSASSMAGGARSEGGEPGPSAGQSGRKSDAGCGCRVAGQQRSHGAVLSCLGLALALTYRRRGHRARAYLAVVGLAASSVLGCGGRTQNLIDSNDGGGLPPAMTAGSSTGGLSGAGATVSGGTGAGGAVQTPPGCVPKLGERVIDHACSHTTNGPFIAVVAGGQADSPDVSDLHRTFEIQVAGSQASVVYRAQRKGSHAFMTDSPAALDLRREGKPISALPSFPVEGCNSVASATVYDLQRDAEYELTLLQGPSTLNLFVEHLGAFGSDAWLEACDD
jgi:MYXO-CTERM domain-containing protein